MMKEYFLVGFGGAFGAIARVAMSRILPSFILTIPLKILCINVIGCFVAGLLAETFAQFWSASLNMRHFLMQGFLGGFTTFSAFSLEFALLYEKGFYASAFTYVFLSVVLSIVFFFLGLKVIRLFS